jgi:hypothetical protein
MIEAEKLYFTESQDTAVLELRFYKLIGLDILGIREKK